MQRLGYDSGHTDEMRRLQKKTLQQMNVVVAAAKENGEKQRQPRLVDI